MRLTSILFRNSRQPQNVKKVPFKVMMPLKLKNYTDFKMQAGDRGCLYEMSLLLTCLEENEYDNKRCISQVNALYACSDRSSKLVRDQKQQSKNKIPTPNSKNQTAAQITYLLQKYPTK